MIFTDPNLIFISIGIVAIIIEIIIGASTGFELFVLGLIFILSGLIGTVTTVNIAIVSMIIFVVLYIFIGRKMIKKSLHFKAHKTNVDSIIGQKAVVTHKITPATPGRIKIEGEIWRAEAEKTIDEGTEVTIISVSGVTVAVE